MEILVALLAGGGLTAALALAAVILKRPTEQRMAEAGVGTAGAAIASAAATQVTAIAAQMAEQRAAVAADVTSHLTRCDVPDDDRILRWLPVQRQPSS